MGVLSVRDNMAIASLPASALAACSASARSTMRVGTGQVPGDQDPSLRHLIKMLSAATTAEGRVSRWLLTAPEILMIDEPTRGIDVGAKAEIHRLISLLAGQGKAILMVSSEMPEILGMSDRVLVMCEGRLTGEFSRAEATQERIMHAATATAAVA